MNFPQFSVSDTQNLFILVCKSCQTWYSQFPAEQQYVALHQKPLMRNRFLLDFDLYSKTVNKFCLIICPKICSKSLASWKLHSPAKELYCLAVLAMSLICNAFKYWNISLGLPWNPPNAFDKVTTSKWDNPLLKQGVCLPVLTMSVIYDQFCGFKMRKGFILYECS